MALQALVTTLHSKGYIQLRAQLIFRGDQYLGSQEPWVEYLDPELPQDTPSGFRMWIKSLWAKVVRS